MGAPGVVGQNGGMLAGWCMLAGHPAVWTCAPPSGSAKEQPPKHLAARTTSAPPSPHQHHHASYPLPSLAVAAGSSGASPREAREAQRARRYAVRLRLAGSGWTPPLALEAPADETPGAGPGGECAALAGARPLLLRALCRSEGLAHEVVARLEVGPHRNCQVGGAAAPAPGPAAPPVPSATHPA